MIVKKGYSFLDSLFKPRLEFLFIKHVERERNFLLKMYIYIFLLLQYFYCLV
jgi:hypothetical protein